MPESVLELVWIEHGLRPDLPAELLPPVLPTEQLPAIAADHRRPTATTAAMPIAVLQLLPVGLQLAVLDADLCAGMSIGLQLAMLILFSAHRHRCPQ